MMKQFIYPILGLLLFASCNSNSENEISNSDPVEEATTSEVRHPEWSKNASIYEVNIRQITPEGTFKAFEEKLPELKDLGVKILWIMPIQPIGELNRKGTLGSYYSIKDYRAVNPEFGTMDDLRSLVDKAHELDFKVILDWVANHSAWDNPWITEHPDWYKQDSEGNIISPNDDWTDVADIDNDNPELVSAMIETMKFWMDTLNIDGFRLDVAWACNGEFWAEVNSELNKVKEIFMLAEAEGPEYHNVGFNMDYNWELMHLTKEIIHGDSNLQSLDRYLNREWEKYQPNDYRMRLLTSHDENSWNGTIEERYAEAEKAIAAFMFNLPGMPMIYSGQEYGNTKALAFFEKDNILYSNPEIFSFYKTLLDLKTENPALWNGEYGGSFEKINSSNDEKIFAFKRLKDENLVLTIVNLSKEPQQFTLELENEYSMQNVFSGENVTINKNSKLELDAYSYLVLKK